MTRKTREARTTRPAARPPLSDAEREARYQRDRAAARERLIALISEPTRLEPGLLGLRNATGRAALGAGSSSRRGIGPTR